MFTSLKIKLHGYCSFLLFLAISISFANNIDLYAQSPEKTPLYYPYAEWEIEHSEYSGNPFDIIATVTFTHSISGQNVTIEMFYDGDWDWETQTQGSVDKFKFRFSGTRLGEWTYTTSSDEAALDGLSGSIEVVEQSDANLARGFVGVGPDQGQNGRKWIWSESGNALIPYTVMRGYITSYYSQDQTRIDDDITEFIEEHGFNGFLYQVNHSWFDPTAGGFGDVNNASSPDLSPSTQSFEVIESTIEKVYEAGGYIHFWEWSSGSFGVENINGGVNGSVHQRLQRYIKARLGPITGWTLGFGWDVRHSATPSELQSWYDYYKSLDGFNHIIGARAHTNDHDFTDESISGGDYAQNTNFDYKGHEDHATINYDGNIAYDRWIDWFNEFSDKPHFSEDRFRQDQYPDGDSRDFTDDRSRITLWQSAMVGGVGSIWGQGPLGGASNARSLVFDNKVMFKLFSDFWTDRFTVDLIRDNSITDGYALATPSKNRLIFYKEDTGSINMDLTGVTIESAIAVDTREAPYTEINISSNLTSDSQNTWTAPGNSDWVISINGSSDDSNPPDSPPAINEVTTTETTAEVSYSEVSSAESYEYRLDSETPVDIEIANPFEITGLNAGTSYDLQMRSVNSDGVSNWSETTTFTTQEASNPPGNPPTIDDITTTKTTAEVSYSEVSGADSYEYRLDEGTPVDIGTTNPFTIEELIPGTSYDLQMRAANSDGSSYWSETATFTTQESNNPPDSPPAINEVTTTKTTAEVSYSVVSGADSYEYRLESGTPTNIGTANPFTVDGLNPGTSYNLQMRSINSEGFSNWSEEAIFTTLSDNAKVPNELLLMQNYPNPFNPITTIRYGVPEEMHVLLEVFDLLGKKIAVLVDEQKSEGFHEVIFNASDLSSGTYLYRIQTEKKVRSKKLVLLK